MCAAFHSFCLLFWAADWDEVSYLTIHDTCRLRKVRKQHDSIGDEE